MADALPRSRSTPSIGDGEQKRQAEAQEVGSRAEPVLAELRFEFVLDGLALRREREYHRFVIIAARRK
jgi:hypothetical protein